MSLLITLNVPHPKAEQQPNIMKPIEKSYKLYITASCNESMILANINYHNKASDNIYSKKFKSEIHDLINDQFFLI